MPVTDDGIQFQISGFEQCRCLFGLREDEVKRKRWAEIRIWGGGDDLRGWE